MAACPSPPYYVVGYATFSDRAVIGGQLFVAAHLANYRKRTGRRMKSAPKPLPALANWGVDLVTLHGLRRDVFG
jgi:hypothetical protein